MFIIEKLTELFALEMKKSVKVFKNYLSANCPE